MPIRPQRPFKHEATLEDLAGFGKNRCFDAVIDDEDFAEIQVICKQGTDDDVSDNKRPRFQAGRFPVTLPTAHRQTAEPAPFPSAGT